MRLIFLSSVFFALSGAFLLYALSNQTRQLEEAAQAKERAVAAMRSDIAILKAERSHLSRPERIEPMALNLGLGAPRPSQFANARPYDEAQSHDGR